MAPASTITLLGLPVSIAPNGPVGASCATDAPATATDPDFTTSPPVKAFAPVNVTCPEHTSTAPSPESTPETVPLPTYAIVALLPAVAATAPSEVGTVRCTPAPASMSPKLAVTPEATTSEFVVTSTPAAFTNTILPTDVFSSTVSVAPFAVTFTRIVAASSSNVSPPV